MTYAAYGHDLRMTSTHGLMPSFTPLKGSNFFISKNRFDFYRNFPLPLPKPMALKPKVKNLSQMNEVHNTNRINLLKEVKTTVNTLFFAPSEQRRKEALASLEALVSFVEAVELPQPKVAKPKVAKPAAKAAKPTAKAVAKKQPTKPKASAQPKAEGMYELFQQFLAEQGITITETSAPSEQVAEPKAKRPVTPRKPKASKPTKTRRPSRNEKLEAQAQKLSLKAAEVRAAKNAPKEQVVCDGKPTAASPFGTRRLVTEGEAKKPTVSKAAQQAALLAEQEAMAAMTAEQLDLFNDDLPF